MSANITVSFLTPGHSWGGVSGSREPLKRVGGFQDTMASQMPFVAVVEVNTNRPSRECPDPSTSPVGGATHLPCCHCSRRAAASQAGPPSARSSCWRRRWLGRAERCRGAPRGLASPTLRAAPTTCLCKGGGGGWVRGRKGVEMLGGGGCEGARGRNGECRKGGGGVAQLAAAVANTAFAAATKLGPSPRSRPPASTPRWPREGGRRGTTTARHTPSPPPVTCRCSCRRHRSWRRRPHGRWATSSQEGVAAEVEVRAAARLRAAVPLRARPPTIQGSSLDRSSFCTGRPDAQCIGRRGKSRAPAEVLVPALPGKLPARFEPSAGVVNVAGALSVSSHRSGSISHARRSRAVR